MINRRQFTGSLAGATAASLAMRVVLAGEGLSEEADARDPIGDLTRRLNPQIQASRDVALGILKPSTAELDRGLKLHTESLVFDAYGFGPRAAIDSAAYAAASEGGASDAELQDLNEEMTMTRFATDAVQQQEFRDAWRASGVTCVFNNAGEEGQDPLRLLKRLARHTYTTDLLRGLVFKAAVPNDILTAKEE